MISLQERYESIQQNIHQACLKSQRSEKEVQLIAISKRQNPEKMQAAYHLGVKNFGESTVQEFLKKHDHFKNHTDIQWHFVGHLQRNKVKHMIDKVHWIHSLDSFSLAEEIEKRASQKNLKINCLIQINIFREAF